MLLYVKELKRIKDVATFAVANYMQNVGMAVQQKTLIVAVVEKRDTFLRFAISKTACFRKNSRKRRPQSIDETVAALTSPCLLSLTGVPTCLKSSSIEVKIKNKLINALVDSERLIATST